MILLNLIFINFITIYILIKIGYKFKLLDLPNLRKKHKKATTYIGGVAIYICYLYNLKFFDFSENFNFLIIIASSMVLLGFLDDFYKLKPETKIIFKTLILLSLIISKNFYLTSLGNYQALGEIKIGSVGVIFFIVATILIMNSYNYFDGKDGLCGSLFISSNLVILIIMFNQKIPLNLFSNFSVYLIIPVLVFLLFNFSIFKLQKTFLGDSGSLLLGFLISFELILITKIETSFHPMLCAWVIALYFYEFVSINFIRFKNKQNLFEPRNDHLHDVVKKRFGSLIMFLFINFLNVFFPFIGYLVYLYLGSLFCFLTFIFIGFIYLYLREKSI